VHKLLDAAPPSKEVHQQQSEFNHDGHFHLTTYLDRTDSEANSFISHRPTYLPTRPDILSRHSYSFASTDQHPIISPNKPSDLPLDYHPVSPDDNNRGSPLMPP
jgi:hypothetical protein